MLGLCELMLVNYVDNYPLSSDASTVKMTSTRHGVTQSFGLSAAEKT